MFPNWEIFEKCLTASDASAEDLVVNSPSHFMYLTHLLLSTRRLISVLLTHLLLNLENFVDAIKILTEDHMSTSGILTSLISRYIEVNGLKTKESAGRFMPDDRMRTAFKTTKYILRGKDLSKRSIPDGTPDDKVKRIKESIKEGSKSAFDRVSDRVDRRTGKPVYDEDTGLLYTTMMVFNNFYRIPPQLLTSEERETLEEEDNIQASKELQDRLSKITAWVHSQK